MKIKDGTAEFRVRDQRLKAMVDFFFPVGTIISRDDDTEPEILKYGKWEKIAEGRVLQGAGGGHNVGENVDAGLPNIMGSFYGDDYSVSSGVTGAFREKTVTKTGQHFESIEGNVKYKIDFSASRSNSIYGASDTVQMAAHFVIYWKRIE